MEFIVGGKIDNIIAHDNRSCAKMGLNYLTVKSYPNDYEGHYNTQISETFE